MNERTPIIIGFCGKEGSGKSTLAQYTSMGFSLRGFYTRTDSFAAPLKTGLAAILNISPRCLQGKDMREQRETYNEDVATLFAGEATTLREAMIVFGQKMRTINSDFWVQAMEIRLRDDTPNILVIDDVRQANEFAWIRSRGGYIFGVQGIGDKPSDREALPYDLLLHNDRKLGHTSKVNCWNVILEAMQMQYAELR